MNITLYTSQTEKVVIDYLKKMIRYHEKWHPFDNDEEHDQLVTNMYGVLEYCITAEEYKEFVLEAFDLLNDQIHE